MACGTCADCATDTHIELFPEEAHIIAHFGHDKVYVCLKCEAQIYRWYYNCKHLNRARCKECESKKEAKN
jgi:DNA-directed RNA polymerase subunit RPC12/RpoP